MVIVSLWLYDILFRIALKAPSFGLISKTANVYGKSSLKRSLLVRLLLSNQIKARAVEHTPKVVMKPGKSLVHQ